MLSAWQILSLLLRKTQMDANQVAHGFAAAQVLTVVFGVPLIYRLIKFLRK